jgi:SAM-dependent methyltransferase
LTECPVCGSPQLVDFFRGLAPAVEVGAASATRESALAAPIGEITLAYCTRCAFVFNRSYDPSRLAFSPGYDASLTHSPLFRSFTDDVVARLTRRYVPGGQRVVEVGSGTGAFLRQICRAGNEGIGFDPSAASESREAVGDGSVRFVRDHYSARHAELQPDLLCCISVLEDIARPGDFVAELRRTLVEGRTHVYFEVFDGGRAIETGSVWSTNYEQCNHWDAASLTGVLARNGFDVLDAGSCYGDGEYVYVEAVAGRGWEGERAVVDPPVGVERFAAAHRERLDTWTRRLDEFCRDGRRVVVWGSGGKGISFLNSLPNSDVISEVIDGNPGRQGRFIPGAGHEIVGPQRLAEIQPDVVIVSNQLYRDEIAAEVTGHDVNCEVLVA